MVRGGYFLACLENPGAMGLTYNYFLDILNEIIIEIHARVLICSTGKSRPCEVKLFPSLCIFSRGYFSVSFALVVYLLIPIIIILYLISMAFYTSDNLVRKETYL